MDKEARRQQFIRDVFHTDNKQQVTHSWSFLFHNNYVRRVLKALFEARKDLSYRKLEELLKTDKKNIHSYLNYDLKENVTQKMSDFHICALANILGIELDVNIIVKENIKLNENG